MENVRSVSLRRELCGCSLAEGDAVAFMATEGLLDYLMHVRASLVADAVSPALQHDSCKHARAKKAQAAEEMAVEQLQAALVNVVGSALNEYIPMWRRAAAANLANFVANHVCETIAQVRRTTTVYTSTHHAFVLIVFASTCNG